MAGKLRVRRKGHHRRGFYIHRNGKRIYIPPTYVKPTTFYIKDRGAPGRGKKVIPIKKGKLHPYSVHLSEKRRHQILARKVKRYGATSVFRALMAQVILRKRTQPHARRIFKKDAEWVKNKYMK